MASSPSDEVDAKLRLSMCDDRCFMVAVFLISLWLVIRLDGNNDADWARLDEKLWDPWAIWITSKQECYSHKITRFIRHRIDYEQLIVDFFWSIKILLPIKPIFNTYFKKIPDPNSGHIQVGKLETQINLKVL